VRKKGVRRKVLLVGVGVAYANSSRDEEEDGEERMTAGHRAATA
jgi:hypothetical protein